LGTKADNRRDCVTKGRHARSFNVGESNPHATLTDDLVLDIRRRFAAGETQAQLHHSLGLTRQQIHKVVRHLSWLQCGDERPVARAAT